ncbi:zinc finger protein 723-like [Wyeomyia smithii]|uniref:zinc finger protein 723-like n=1 Tax=Wyeomyia smithii TaxID=174621 RepID=UPI0024681E56|nr:zinc finger protein 723-like [Wyeomyia smithii]
MIVFKLERFPLVCRMCLKPATDTGMVSLDKTDPLFDGSMQDFITTVTFEIAKSKIPLLPQMACQQCVELLKFFAKYRMKLLNLHLFMNSLIELKSSNSAPMIDLFRSKPNQLAMLFKDLDLCTKSKVFVEDLIKEFPTYHIANMTTTNKENMQDEQIVDPLENGPSAFYAEECTADELAELIPQQVSNQKKANEDEHYQLFEVNEADEELGCIPVKKTAKRDRRKELLHCDKCKFVTYYPANFRNHRAVHIKRENKVYMCHHIGCSEKFKDARSRNRHYFNVHKPHVCDTCGLQFSNLSGLQTHKTRHLSLFNHCCTYCGHRANTKQDLRTHVNTKHNAAYFFACEICGLQFKRKSIMIDHMETHTNARKYKCTRCDKSFQKYSSLDRHKKTVHENRRIPCEHCDRTFLKREVLRDHIEYVHNIQTHFTCDVCLQLFYEQETLNAHKLRHENPKENECKTCLAVFTSSDTMKNHLCISYRDDYICCGRDYRYHYQYNKHVLIKHGKRINARVKPDPYHLLGYLRYKRKRIETCPKCETTFNTRNQKKLHMETCVGPAEDDQMGQDIEHVE